MQSPREHQPGLIQTVGSAISGAVNALGDLISRIVNGIKNIVPAILTIGCTQQAPLDSQSPALPHESIHVNAPAPAEIGSSFDPTSIDQQIQPIADFSITFYYVVTEDEIANKQRQALVANDNATPDDTAVESTLASVANDTVTIWGKGCQPIAEVSREFASQVRLQGTGRLRDGRLVNVGGRCGCDRTPCFHVVKSAHWGTGGTGHHLEPFRTVAVDPKLIKLGSLLYVPLLEGRLMPGRPPWGGFVHDGCVIADDVGGGIKGTQLDLFVGRRGWFLGLSGHGGSHSWAKSVPVFDGTKLCEQKGRHVTRKAGAI